MWLSEREFLHRHFDIRIQQAGEVESKVSNNSGATASGGAIYGIGVFGAWVYFWQQADGFWEYVLAIVQGIFWPAWMVYEAFSALD